MMRLSIFCLLFALASSSMAAEPIPFHFYKDVDGDVSEEEEILAVTLDSEVYAATRDRFPDLRILDHAGAEMPYRFEKVTGSRIHTTRSTCQSRVVSLQENDDNSIEIRVGLDKKALAADGLSVFTPLRDHERRVGVSGSRDGKSWEPLVTDGLIFDYSRYMDVHNRDIRLPKNRHRQFKIVIDDVTTEQESPWKELTRKFQEGQEKETVEKTTVQRRAFRIDRIEFWSESHKKYPKDEKKTEYPIVNFRVEEDTEEKRTIIDVKTRREPLTSFTLQTASRNFSRRAVVQKPVQRGINTEWVDVGQATVSVVHFGSFRREELKITFGEQRQEDYRIIIYNKDNPPLEITGVATEGNVYRLVFLAQEGEAYRVYYDSESAEEPSYDTAAVLASLRTGYQLVEAPLGDQVANPDFGERPGFVLLRLLNNKLFLGVAICLAVAVLAWGLFHAGRRIETISQE